MDNEEKKEKTAPKKKTMPKKEEPKKVVAKKVKAESTDKSGKRKSQTKTSSKKTTTTKKTVTKKEPTKKVNVPMESTKDANQKEKIKEQRVITNESKSSKVSPELLEIRRKRHLIEAIIIAILVFIVLILLSNRTFLGVIYKNDHINISIPRFSYYVNDKDNKVKFVTLRKSKYLNEYYNEYLEGFTFYSCSEGENTFYYNEQNKSLIKEIKIEKYFAIKAIEITYDTRTPEEVCGLK